MSYGVTISVSGLPANSEVTGSVTGPLGTDAGTLRASPSGIVEPFGVSGPTPGVYTLRISSAFVFERSLTASCQTRPTSAEQCKRDGWRRYGIFKNQGDCVSYLVTNGRNAPAPTAASA